METNYLIKGSNTELFNYKNLGSVRVKTDQNGNPWFCLVDVCTILGLNKNDINKVNNRIDIPYQNTALVGVQTGVKKDGTPAIQNVNMKFVNEAGLYQAIGQSRRPEAKAFMNWVFSEVLPMIRRTGMYVTDDKYQELLTNPGKLGEMLINYQKQLDKLKTENMIVNNLASQDAIEYDSLLEENEELIRENERLRDLLDEQYEEDLSEDFDY